MKTISFACLGIFWVMTSSWAAAEESLYSFRASKESIFDIKVELWNPHTEGSYGSFKLDKETTLSPSLSIGADLGSNAFIQKRLGLRYDFAEYDFSGSLSKLQIQNFYFDWDGFRFGDRDLGLDLGGSLRYAQVSAEFSSFSGLEDSIGSLFPEIRLRGHWKPISFLGFEAGVKQGFPFGSGQNSTSVDAGLRIEFSRNVSLNAGYRMDWLKLGDMGAGHNEAIVDLRSGGPVFGFEIRF